MTREEAIKELTELLPEEFLMEYSEALDMAIKALEQEPCEDAISRQAVLDAFGLSEKSRKYGGDHSGYDTLMKYEIQDILEDLPSVTPQPKMGRWERDKFTNQPMCSVCGYKVFGGQTNYCPNCGAKMSEIPTGAEGSDKE